MIELQFSKELQEILTKVSPQVVSSNQERLADLYHIGVKSLQDLRDLVRDKNSNEELRVFACWLLGRFNGEEDVDTWIELLRDEFLSVCVTAAQSLSFFDNEKILLALIKFIEDTSDDWNDVVVFLSALTDPNNVASWLIPYKPIEHRQD